MTSSKSLIEAWKTKSDSDLLTCQRLLSFDDPTVDTILFHAQQAVEKALKAYLISKKTHFSNTHDLRYLQQLAKQHDGSFDQLDEIASMNAYAVEIRYPESIEWLNEVDVNDVVRQADHVCKFIWLRVNNL
ncbi:MAG: HEPN domain-containing protein [Mariprofundaceae bacterium]|nr:HEPN domain-containing protein [Mariprofundaceae bacterium]